MFLGSLPRASRTLGDESRSPLRTDRLSGSLLCLGIVALLLGGAWSEGAPSEGRAPASHAVFGISTPSVARPVGPLHVGAAPPPPGNTTISGTISPMFAILTINELNVFVQPGGKFSQRVLPGELNYVNASAAGYSLYNQTFTLTPGQNKTISIVLNPLKGWINGTVYPPGATVTVDGNRVPVNVKGGFNLSATPQVHSVDATLSGYDEIDQTVIVPPGGTAYVNFSLNVTQTNTTFLGLTTTQLIVVIGVSAAAVGGAVFILLRGRGKRVKPSKWAPSGS